MGGRQKKIKLPGAIEGIREALFPRLLSAAVAVIFIVAVFTLVKAFLYRSDYFRLRSVETRVSFPDQRVSAMISGQILKAYKDRNIFSVNLASIAQAVKKSYGDIKDVTAAIALPDKLVISLKLRKPVALVRNEKYYPVDEEGIVIPGMGRVDALKDMPVIEGVDMKAVRGKASQGALKSALSLLKDIKETRFMNAYGVAVINASDPNNIYFLMKNGIEVRMGGEDFRNRLNMLGKTLRDPRLVADRIRYIDVRFKDVYIGPK